MEAGQTRGVRLRICASADERPGPANSALAFAAAEHGCLVLRRRDGSAIAALPFDDFVLEDIGERMVSMAPKLPTGALAKDGSIVLALRDDARWEEFWGLIASLRSFPQPQNRLHDRVRRAGNSPDDWRDAGVSRSPTCRGSAGDGPDLRRAHRDIHAGKLQSSLTDDKGDLLRQCDRHAASIPDCLPPIPEETEEDEEEMESEMTGHVAALAPAKGSMPRQNPLPAPEEEEEERSLIM